MSKRERLIAAGVGATIGIFVLDRAVITPLMAQEKLLSDQITQEENEFRADKKLVQAMPVLKQRWTDNRARGLFPDQPSAAGQLTDKLQELAQEQNLNVTRVTPSQTATLVQRTGTKASEQSKDRAFMRLTARINATGNMSQISQFVWRLQHCEIPVRITELIVDTNKEGNDDLKINMQVATIFLAPEPHVAGAANQANQGNAPASRPVSTTTARGSVAGGTSQPARTETRQ